MPKAFGYFVNQQNVYKDYKLAQAEVLGTSKGTHAEKAVYKILTQTKDSPFLIMQDAFPCVEKCHRFFKDASALGSSIILRVLGDEGSYSMGHNNRNFPCTIYYHSGEAAYDLRPNGFPGPAALPTDLQF